MIQDGINELQQQVSGILMIGQSNMAGRGEMGDVEPIDNPNCLMLRIGRWQRMLEPINPDRSMFVGLYRSGVGLAASFADDYAKYSGGKVGLIPCADGGTCLGQWMPGEMDYDYAVALASLAKRICTLRGIIWHQGESDCADEALIDTYKERFIRMITQLPRVWVTKRCLLSSASCTPIPSLPALTPRASCGSTKSSVRSCRNCLTVRWQAPKGFPSSPTASTSIPSLCVNSVIDTLPHSKA